jgi:hypothetical protein
VDARKRTSAAIFIQTREETKSTDLQDLLEPRRVSQLRRGLGDGLKVWYDFRDVHLQSTTEEHAVETLDEPRDGHDLRASETGSVSSRMESEEKARDAD